MSALALVSVGLLVAACASSSASSSPSSAASLAAPTTSAAASLEASPSSSAEASPSSSSSAEASGSAGAEASSSSGAEASSSSGAEASSSSGAGASSSASAGAFPSFDTSSIIAGLANIDSYQQTITVNGQQVYQAIVVTKPTASRAITVSGGAKIVIIGDKSWLATDGKTFQSVPSTAVTSMISRFDPSLMLGAFGGPALTQNATDMGTEQKNGVSAHHFHVDATSLPASSASFPPNAAIDIWVADQGYLVALETTGLTGTQALQIETTNVNDPANVVTQPS